MTPDDEDDGFDPADADPEVRELREQVRALEAAALRTRAELDQLWAALAEREAEGARTDAALDELRAQVAELSASMDAQRARWARTRRVYAWLIPLTWAVAGASIVLNLW